MTQETPKPVTQEQLVNVWWGLGKGSSRYADFLDFISRAPKAAVEEFLKKIGASSPY
ncbi:MAG: hypothetical protein Greene07147_842 [Parcubacteria group bacterium Greene0714_7]|nr:MAG: hypothetical protein Greene07147_842 [Parcubacteria group bacterium Greene0714_7]